MTLIQKDKNVNGEKLFLPISNPWENEFLPESNSNPQKNIYGY